MYFDLLVESMLSVTVIYKTQFVVMVHDVNWQEAVYLSRKAPFRGPAGFSICLAPSKNGLHAVLLLFKPAVSVSEKFVRWVLGLTFRGCEKCGV